MPYKTCPRCGYKNVAHASVCFQCTYYLDNSSVHPGIKPYHHDMKLVEAEQEEEQETTRQVPTRDQLIKEANGADLQSADGKTQFNAALICLRCGYSNEANTEFCDNCGAALLIPDEILKLTIRTSARSNVGQIRSNNEDNVGVWARHGVVLALVADGMGGAVAGEQASRLTKEAIQADFTSAAQGSENLQELTDVELRQKLRLAIEHANQVLLDNIQEDSDLQGMGTTATLAVMRGNQVTVAHIGDSRAYHVKGGRRRISQITDDHSFVEALVASGHITAEQAAIHPMRSVLYRALGQNDISEADLYTRTVEAGDRLVLCSDGLTRHVSPDEIAQIAFSYDEPTDITQTLIDLANQRGGEDNISVVALVVFEDEQVAPLEQLKPLDCEQERGKFASDMYEKTGPIPDIDLDNL